MPRCMCARRTGGTSRDQAGQQLACFAECGPAQTAQANLTARQIFRHVAEFPQQLASPNSPVMGSPLRLNATAPMWPGSSRQDLGAAQRGRRALAFLGGARDRRSVLVAQEGQCNVIGDIGHGVCSDVDGSGGAAACSASCCAGVSGTQPAEIAACNSSSSASRYSLAMISALMVLAQIAVAHRDRLIAGLFIMAVVGRAVCGHRGLSLAWRRGGMFLFCSFRVKLGFASLCPSSGVKSPSSTRPYGFARQPAKARSPCDVASDKRKRGRLRRANLTNQFEPRRDPRA